MHIAILTFEGYNELDSLIALGVLNRIRSDDWRVTIATPTARVTSMNGVTVEQMTSLEEAVEADAVIVGSGIATREVVETPAIMHILSRLDPGRQLIAAQCSGALILAKLGLLRDVPACTDLVTKPWVSAAGVRVLDQPFFAKGNIATAGGCLASQYLAAWVITRLLGRDEAVGALHYVAPVGEKQDYIDRAWRNIEPYLAAEIPARL
ncbi:DJ-1/PfpI family protein [Mycolicibacterium poriferae]|uniref:Glutamine amidotransferase n=1 Tax=Mycolicibacterium poriferae TaxID=39694 RepID=A0A6N4V6P9_9MYCO|nr:DJ-1/PfpI family protein [Mycolicibacterium poriferae]MCV7262246.1 DJ-1/PfpI family protein [Mycolicibacterium poriferae]BBX49467.1 glutamine amidotransferase [Mycolicibacterium poriferae]